MISDDALVLDTFPSKGIAIIGAGYIAVEFAGIFRGFGAEVHLVYRGEQPLRGFDGDVRAAVVDNLKARGMHLHPGCHPVRCVGHCVGCVCFVLCVVVRAAATCTWRHSIERGDGFYSLFYTVDGDAMEQRLDVSAVFMATGRAPRTANLGLEVRGAGAL